MELQWQLNHRQRDNARTWYSGRSTEDNIAMNTIIPKLVSDSGTLYICAIKTAATH